MGSDKKDIIGIILISAFLILLSYAGYISYKSIDWNVLKKLESQQLVLPTPISTPSAQIINPNQTASPTAKP